LTSADVNRALRGAVWPALKEHGFDRRTARTAWRDRSDQVDVVNFQSFNAYNAAVLGATTFSFQINLGTHPRCRTSTRTPQRNDQVRPQEYECDFRRQLTKAISQSEIDRPTLWFVRPDGANLAEVIDDARLALLGTGLGWFDRLAGLDAMLSAARNAPEDMGNTWGMGNIGSPHRKALVAALDAEASSRFLAE
jgi:hypothetical protein